jgi:hypothetical protein
MIAPPSSSSPRDLAITLHRGTSDAIVSSMPSSEEILRLTAAMAGDLRWLAIAWHLTIVIAAAAIIAGWRPRAPLGLALLVAPAASVSIAALAYGNPFNGISFGLLAIVFVVLAATLPRALAMSASWSVSLGIALILYGTCYPHFVDGPWYRTLYAAPVGVIPCPTLAVLAGFTLLAGGFSARATVVLTVWVTFYAIFGIFRLGVMLDAGLLVAAAGLVVMTATSRRFATRSMIS